LKIIDEISKVSNEEGVRGAIKFQFRQIDTFIHPNFKDRTDLPHIPRFVSTRISNEDYEIFTKRVEENKLTTMATPFDEESVELIKRLGIEIIKIASCSASDWPLIEKVAEAHKPVVVSTAGLSMNSIDDLVSFLELKHVEFALMHCVALYPTPTVKLQLNQIEIFKKRYPHITVGFSTHEPPDYLDGIKIAYAKGARVFERHVGIENNEIKLNPYSSTPQQIRRWLRAYKEAVCACGAERRPPVGHKEEESLRSLKRGVYAKEEIKKGTPLRRSVVFFAMPLQENQLESGYWKDCFTADKDYKRNEPISEDVIERFTSTQEIINRIVLQIKGMLNEARIPIGNDYKIELSHHYGLERFREFGAIIIDCINRAYCKKLILMLPRQKHPYHYHKRKEETFQVLFGEMEVEIEGNRHVLRAGDSIVIHQNEWHKFQTANGVIFEEISTTHFDDDSFYEDKFIARIPREERKTKIENMFYNRYRSTGNYHE
nr:cupin domain-containing protein [Desulfobacterales bacterium]